MNRAYVAVALAGMMAMAMVSMSYAGASCCDPANAAGGLQQIRAARPGPVTAPNPASAAGAYNPRQEGRAAFSGYGQTQPIPLSNLTPGGSCCPSPKTAAASRANAPIPQPLQIPATGCSGACGCGKVPQVQSTRAVEQFGVMPLGAVRPVPQTVAPVPAARTPLTATPLKAAAKNKPSVYRTLW